jgi:uncharacterized protein
VLTADLVNARRRGDELCLVQLDTSARPRILALAAALVATCEAHVGSTREELLLALSAIEVQAREHRVRDGLTKLVEDRCEFDASDALDPADLRREVFERASAVRAALEAGGRFERSAVIAEVASARGVSEEAVERGLFADLRGAHRLVAFDAPSADALVAAYESGQAQAVLLRAVQVTVDVRCASAGGLRVLFRRLKFLRLLHTIAKTDGGHRVVIDGPFSLFESSTKYGLQLALVLPALESCDEWKLQADIRWGKERTPLVFRLSGGSRSAAAEAPPLPDEVEAFVQAFAALKTEWSVAANTDILEFAGVGLAVPDLVFERWRPGGRDRLYFEVMGYWSRAAVWRRVELVQAGLVDKVLFAVSAHLRVSEDVLEADLPSALYVYKRTMSARAVVERLEFLAARSRPGA